MNKNTTDTTEITLDIEVESKLIKSNFPEFKEMALGRIREMNGELITDEDFARASDDIKVLKETEKMAEEAKDRILQDLDETYELIRGLGEIRKEASDVRLAKTRAITRREKAIQEEIIKASLEDLELTSNRHRRSYRSAIYKAMRGKRGKNKIASWRKAARSEVEVINSVIVSTQEILNEHAEKHGEILDYADLEVRDPEVVREILDGRVRQEAERKARHEAELKARQAAEEARKAQEALQAAETPQEAEKPSPAPTTPQETPKAHEEAAKAHPAPAPAGPISPEKEVQEFALIVAEAFEKVIAYRNSMRNPRVKKAALEFGTDCAAAWKKFISTPK